MFETTASLAPWDSGLALFSWFALLLAVAVAVWVVQVLLEPERTARTPRWQIILAGAFALTALQFAALYIAGGVILLHHFRQRRQAESDAA